MACKIVHISAENTVVGCGSGGAYVEVYAKVKFWREHR